MVATTFVARYSMTGDEAASVMPPPSAGFESGALPFDVIVTWRKDGGWRVSSVLVRQASDPPRRHPPWLEPFSPSDDPPDLFLEWEYLADRVRTGQGGNGYSFELSGFEVAELDDVAPVVNALAAEAVAATHGPLGEVAGTILFDQPAGEGTVIMPVVLLRDDRGDVALVLTDVSSEPSVRIVAGPEVDARPFQSIEQWQRAGAPSWPVVPGSRYTVSWDHNRVDVFVGLDGHFTQLEPGAHEDQSAQAAPVTFAPSDPPAGDMRIERIGVPRWVAEHDYDEEAMFSLFGDGVAWSFAIPWMHHALASPLTHEPMLAAPRAGDDFWPGALAYWSSLLHLLVYSFGWSRPDRGLRWWYDAGKPTPDLRLQLISQVWDRDGQLDLLAAWLWTTAMPDVLASCTDRRSDGLPVDVNERWLEQARQQEAAFGGPSPYGGGGGDPLHLAGHLDGPLADPAGEVILLRGSREERRAVLLTASLAGWYRALVERGAMLPDLGDRSWRVDVIVRSVGWLGTYRRSRLTNLWFAGQHRYHVVGN